MARGTRRLLWYCWQAHEKIQLSCKQAVRWKEEIEGINYIAVIFSLDAVRGPGFEVTC